MGLKQSYCDCAIEFINNFVESPETYFMVFFMKFAISLKKGFNR